MIEFAEVELVMPYGLRIQVRINLVCVMRLDVDGKSWIPDQIFLYDDDQTVFRGMQHEKYVERTRCIPRILSLKVVALRERQSFRWSERRVPEYRWCHWINWIRTLELASAKVAEHIAHNYSNEVAVKEEAKVKGV